MTIHIPFPARTSLADLPPDSPSLAVLQDLHNLYHSTPHFATYVDVHLAFSPFSRKSQDGDGEGGRQFNVWRNVARLFARTEFVMMLDVDFAVCTDWRTAVRRALQDAKNLDSREVTAKAALSRRSQAMASSNSEESPVEVARMLREGSAALVVPVFEYISQEDGEDQWTFPQSKEVRAVMTSGAYTHSFLGAELATTCEGQASRNRVFSRVLGSRS